ncbi:PREDICTED: uncharacterized protein LOC109234655, partial [Nicotiana attenuata]|uniref:uncharacterized protein LOC109234655 n=1 Tax=Nicotiana attenuata TaxID=49451 RepID=UPI000905375F
MGHSGRPVPGRGSSGPSQSYAQSSTSAPPSVHSYQQGSHSRPGSDSRRSRQSGRPRVGSQQRGGTTCPKCGRFHAETCYLDIPVCYRCGVRGHIQWDSRVPSQGMGRGSAQSSGSSVATSSVHPAAPAGRGAARSGARGRGGPSRKANVVADALSRKSMGSLAHLGADQRLLAREVYQLASLGVCISTPNEEEIMVHNSAESSLIKEAILNNKTSAFSLGGNDGVLRCQGRLCVPDVDDLRERIMAEAHHSRYSVHPGSTKMYHDLKEIYWWSGMKRGVADFVSKCPNCQQVKTDGQAERTIQTLEDMLRACVLDFKGNWDDHLPLIEFAYNNSFHASIQMAPFEALYGRRCRSPIGWFEAGEAELIGPDLVHQAMEKVKVIQERMKTAQSRQKSYADVRRRGLEFQVDDWVFLRVSPMKGVMRFGKKGKLSPRYVGPYRKVVGDPSSIVPVEDIKVTEELSYEEIPVAILDRQVRKLRNKEIASVKVLWRNQQVEEATWEAEDEMKEKYPH